MCTSVVGTLRQVVKTGRVSVAWFAAVILLTHAGPFAMAQAPPDEAHVKAAFIYNFLKFVDWPAAAFPGARDPLIVGIVGTGATANAAAGFLNGKPVGNRAIKVRRLTDDSPVSGVHALFINTADPNRLRRMLDAAAKGSVLSVGESTDFAAKGGVIGLLVDAQKVRFEINPDAAAIAHLRISSKLLALARIVSPRKSVHEPP